jgi:hypothetical protein
MKKIFILLILVLAAQVTRAQQQATFVLNQQPCNMNGTVTATFLGLTAPMNVTWYVSGQLTVTHNGVNSTSDVLTGYGGGYLSVVAVGANMVTAVGNFSALPFNYTDTTTPAQCPALGTATIMPSGGVAPYTYQWYDANTLALVSTSNPASLPTGSYEVTITDANGCIVTSQMKNDSIFVSNINAFNFNINTTAANCTNGTATVGAISGGTPPYSYLWNNNATTASISGLTQGFYNVTVTDANGCQAYNSASVQQAIQIGANITTTSATCIQTNGAMTVFGSGGTPPYTYLWNNSITAQTQTNIASGSYNVVVTDANGCTGMGYAYVGSTTPINATKTSTPSSCTSPTGSATVNISGGTAPYTVTWSTFPAQTGTTATNLAPGFYSFHIVDAVGCVRNGSVNVDPINIITGYFPSTNPTCLASNGSVSFQPSGGAAPYTYLWSNNATTQAITGVPAGSYSVTVTDNVGCSVTKAHYLNSTSPLSLGAATTQASCIFTSDGSITITPTGGTAPYTYSWSNGGNTATISGLATGYYTVSVTDANGCTAYKFVHVPYNSSANSCYCTITGKVYNDANGNCTQDPGEAGIQNIQVHCSNVGYAYTNSSGNYSFIVPTGSYTIKETVQAYYPLASCQNNNVVVNAVASSGCTQTVNFANSVATIHDMHISKWQTAPPIPGFLFHTTTIVSNDGTVTESSIVGGMQHDIQLPSTSISPSSIWTNGGPNRFQINSGALTLAPGNSQAAFSSVTTPTNIPLGTGLVFYDSVAYTGPISNWMNDYTPWNNVAFYSTNVVGAYDPNFKEVSPKGTGPTGIIMPKDSVLEYMVHFQNLGTYKAQNVEVLDTLDADLDWTTLRPIYKSHPCVVTLSDGGVAKFTFKNINLPAKIYDEMGSNGMFTYTIKRKNNLAVGTQFKNSAAIYFDYNEPVITNTTVNTLGTPVGVPATQQSEAGTFSVFPNPANRMIYAQVNSKVADAAGAIKVIDLSGKVLISNNVILKGGSQNIPVSVETLTPGIYFISLTSNGASQTQKFVIMK